MRITLLAGAILLLCSIILTLGASYNAHTQLNNVTLAGPYGVVQKAPISGEIELHPSDVAIAAPSTKVAVLTAAKKQFDIVNVLILAGVSVFGMVLVYVVAGKSLRPIHELSKTASTIGEENLQKRIPNLYTKDEVGMLGNSFNAMLDRLEQSFVKQKRFSANAAHELKTPLSTINASIQVLHLDKNPAASDYEETFETVERNVKRLIMVVDDLMKLYDENDQLEIVPIDLKSMFEAIVCELSPVIENRNIETELICGLKTVKGNQVLIYRAFFNLIENAAKYNKDGGKIVIEAKREGEVGMITITDTGNGIPAYELQQIFEPFYRVSKSRSRKTGGAGLGLSIVKTIIEKHGWKVSVNSELGEGSTFSIIF
jgi:signal transduction histidine kinase